MDIKPPTQALFLSGESPEVDNLVQRARPVEAAHLPSRAPVPRPVPARVSAYTTALFVPETPIYYEVPAASATPRIRTATELYRQVQNVSKPQPSQRFLDVFV